MGLYTTMSQLTEMHVQITDGLSVGDQESDCDDDDRRELISHYANDKYLSKWEVAEEEEEIEEETEKLDEKEPSIENSEKKEAAGDKTVQRLVTASDCDDLSLVSYNSVRDCNPSATPKTAPTSVHHHLGLLSESTGDGLKLWQGYGGNIYFNAVRCQSMRINSAKYGKLKKDFTKRWKSKSCNPLNRKDGYQTQLLSSAKSDMDIAIPSSSNLGSLRMRSCKEKKCKRATCRHSEIPKPLTGKICKGFSEKLLTETFKRLQEDGGYGLKGESLSVSGGQVGDALIDPIDKVRQFNTQLKGRDIAVSLERGFPTLLSDSSFFSHSDHRSSTVVTANADPFVKLPVLGNTDGKHGNSKTENGSSSENNSNEPRPVFIIPFGAFDDPVDSEPELKRKADRKEKPLSKSLTDRNNYSSGSLKEAKNSLEKLDDSVITECPVDKVADGSVYNQENDQNSVKYSVASSGVVKDEKASCSPRSAKQTVPDFHLKREISNLSLSNYLKAVPTRGSQEQDSLTSPRSNLMPKISYTERSRALPTFYMVNNSLHQVNHTGFNSPRANTSHVYGGYFPTTGRNESKVFYAEISTSSEKNSSPSGDDKMQGFLRRTRSTSPKKVLSNSRIPFLKTNYLSRKSLSRKSVERSPRAQNSLKSDQSLLHVPVTGHQFSRLSGVSDR